jgi:GABA(A) receptor-associated protein
MIRKSTNVGEKKNIFFYIGNEIVSDDSNIYDLYKKKKDKDGYLYISYSDLDVFG